MGKVVRSLNHVTCSCAHRCIDSATGNSVDSEIVKQGSGYHINSKSRIRTTDQIWIEFNCTVVVIKCSAGMSEDCNAGSPWTTHVQCAGRCSKGSGCQLKALCDQIGSATSRSQSTGSFIHNDLTGTRCSRRLSIGLCSGSVGCNGSCSAIGSGIDDQISLESKTTGNDSVSMREVIHSLNNIT